ncbi:XrtA/PEP-CTERM system exopolysaccharide export protein [uncultured Aquabacterium sp.]|jgi:polysaccharide export outer membrane protein|uniref:XrtA/PEP-CTERM system exopolysaccharide export protein n=2 Tax=Aquabacterium TaxID=92793 RepID=UPI0030CCCE79|tara:strand:- start:36 stop:779 length:744 start_codon:yes stop_codon:yes gene_type:complete
MMSDQFSHRNGCTGSADCAKATELRKSAELPKEDPMTFTNRKIIGRAGVLLALCASLLVTGCGSTFNLPPAPQRVAADDKTQGYQIGALDELSVVVWRNPDLSATVTVRPDGKISLPLVENLPAAGRRPDDLSRQIEAALGKYIREPVVTVVVNRALGETSAQVRIVGEAAKPQAVAFRQNMTLLDVMIQVGGLTDFADGNNAVLVRGSENSKQYSVRIKDLLRRGDISANVDMKPGDILIIPQSWF